MPTVYLTERTSELLTRLRDSRSPLSLHELKSVHNLTLTRRRMETLLRAGLVNCVELAGDDLWSPTPAGLAAVALGCYHLSLDDLRRIARESGKAVRR